VGRGFCRLKSFKLGMMSLHVHSFPGGTADRQSASKIAVFAPFLAKSTTCCFSALQRLINSIGISISSIHSFGPAGPRCKSVCVVFPQQCQVRGLSPDKVRCSFRCGFRAGSREVPPVGSGKFRCGFRAGGGLPMGVPGWCREGPGGV
jgi:hypothetical protein